MATLALSASQTSLRSPPSPSSMSSSSSRSLHQEDEENLTITTKLAPSTRKGKQKSQEDLRLLAISTHITELSYTISDIQTRIFEIQELRHKSQASGDNAGTTVIIDQSLMSLDERIETVSKGMKLISDSLEPILQTPTTPDSDPNAVILRKHSALVAEWEAVQDESDVLREELKEDKWLTVFRTVTDQADGMMSSLEKAVNRCQEFIWQVHKHYEDPLSHSISSQSGDKALTFETYTSLLESFEAKKKHYMPATSKVLSIIDKGVRDRVTKNGETLRRHAESAQRWKSLKERITRTDAEMDVARRLLLGEETPSEVGSGRNGHLNTPSRTGSAASTISRSISPFRKFARKIAGSTVTPLSINKNNTLRAPSSEPTQSKARHRTSIFGIRPSVTPTPITPERPGHRHTQSVTPDSSPRGNKILDSKSRNGTVSSKPGWNSSTKVDDSGMATVKATPPKRPPSATGTYNDISSTIGGVFRRSFSRTSMASSRPWSPVTSSVSTTQSSSRPPLPSSHPPLPNYRPPSRSQAPSRAQTPSRPQTPSRSHTPGIPMTPRARPKTPSHIPAPSSKARSTSVAPPMSDDGWDDEGRTTTFQRALSPSAHPPRPPSRSLIPIPTLHLSSASRPSSSMSYNNDDSTFRSNAARAQTPEFALRARVQQLPIFPGTPSRPSARPSLPGSAGKLPPSSFREGSTSRTPSRSGSRSGMYTPTESGPLHEYVPGNPRDPLDAEVAIVVNAISHGLLVERVDPPIKKLPKEGEEQKAQYAFSNALSRKVITCKLTTLTRPGKADVTKKVMVRVGGGWQDLSHYILNRQAAM
ncbi:GAR domain-containing protein [Mycena indigotica]|uniref:GAR domain-containing protein n=1 Tax=Mycena indigotica TaxID=2126181 RepID=A0A8H6WCK3_9AGAR|nr:GAR domain-containing protein [Mycena indigotica]KAF7309843.1 GAR domain-containing protein [Mycena indigotica]